MSVSSGIVSNIKAYFPILIWTSFQIYLNWIMCAENCRSDLNIKNKDYFVSVKLSKFYFEFENKNESMNISKSEILKGILLILKILLWTFFLLLLKILLSVKLSCDRNKSGYSKRFLICIRIKKFIYCSTEKNNSRWSLFQKESNSFVQNDHATD